MKFELKELNSNVGMDVYEMYQDIPDGENGQTNECYGLSYDDYKKFLNKEISRKYNKLTEKDTPTTMYIMYADDKPVGLIGLRTEIDDKWKKWSGNFYYKIRLSERKKRYSNKILSLGLIELKKLGFHEVYGQSSKGNIASSKAIEYNGGILIKEVNGTKYYKIIL